MEAIAFAAASVLFAVFVIGPIMPAGNLDRSDEESSEEEDTSSDSSLTESESIAYAEMESDSSEEVDHFIRLMTNPKFKEFLKSDKAKEIVKDLQTLSYPEERERISSRSTFSPKPTEGGYQMLVDVNTFSELIGMRYTDALDRLSETGYRPHILYVNRGLKKPLDVKDVSVVGVGINDPDYDHYSNQPSPNAVINRVIDIGGVDENNTGMIL